MGDFYGKCIGKYAIHGLYVLKIRRPLAKLEGEARGKDKANANSFR